jgi:23S rRNA pseudouridine1911/1915/1917 synthase
VKRERRVVVTEALDGVRLDRALAALIDDVSRAELARWIAAGAVDVEGTTRTKSADKVRAGSTLVVRPMPPPPSDALPDATVPIDVVYEDASIVVVNKPAGMVVHPSKGHATGTLVNGLLARFSLAPPDVREDDDAHVGSEREEAMGRPGIVHRIDRGTSGLLVVARTAKAREALKRQFAAHTIERVYDAIVVTTAAPLPDRASFDTAYGRHPTDRKRFTSKPRTGGKRAVTQVRVVERFAKVGAALVECRLETGRTHQIRVHLSENGAPLLGDPLYGKPPKDQTLRAMANELGRQALHARVLGFEHPIHEKQMHFEAEWPDDFARAVAELRTLG